MAELGKLFKLTYAAVNFRSGLTGITAVIIKPDGTKLGPAALNEFADPELAGVYYLDVPTNSNDPSGDWIAIVNEAGKRSPIKINLMSPVEGSVSSELADLKRLIMAVIDDGKIVGEIAADEEDTLSGIVEEV